MNKDDRQDVEAFQNDVEASVRAYERSLRDPATALPLLVKAIQETNEARPTKDWKEFPLPVKVLEVLQVEASQTFHMSSLTIRARALRADGVEDVVDMGAAHSYGFKYGLEDAEGYAFWESLNDQGEPIKWKALFVVEGGAPQSVHEIIHRKYKAETLQHMLRRSDERTRFDQGVLYVDAAREDEAHKAIARYMLHLPHTNNFWHAGPLQ